MPVLLWGLGQDWAGRDLVYSIPAYSQVKAVASRAKGRTCPMSKPALGEGMESGPVEPALPCRITGSPVRRGFSRAALAWVITFCMQAHKS